MEMYIQRKISYIENLKLLPALTWHESVSHLPHITSIYILKITWVEPDTPKNLVIYSMVFVFLSLSLSLCMCVCAHACVCVCTHACVWITHRWMFTHVYSCVHGDPISVDLWSCESLSTLIHWDSVCQSNSKFSNMASLEASFF